MSTEREAMRVSHHEAATDGVSAFSLQQPDFKAMSDRQLEAYQEHLASYISGHMADLRSRFNAVLSGPEAQKFSGFFEHCDQMKRNGEPAYVLMFER